MSDGDVRYAHEAPAPRETMTDISPQRLHIAPSRGWASLNLRDLWEYRELLYFLVWRDIKVQYKQTILGVAWALIQPLFAMVVFSIFFGRLARVPSDGVPYPLFAFAGLVPWTFFARGLSESANSLVGSGNLIKKVYFPRLIVPMAAVVCGVPDMGLSLLVFGGMMAYYGVWPRLSAVVWLPALFLVAAMASLGAGTWLSAMNVKYRDVRYVVPPLVQFWMFATPIAYPASLLAAKWRMLYALNPMVGVVEGFRFVLVGTAADPADMIGVSAVVALTVLVSGVFYFRQMERAFADVV